MKKLLFSVLLSAVMCLTAPALKAEAAQTGSGSFKLEVEEPVIQATYGEVTAMPATEYNADKVTVVSDAYTIGDKTHLLLKLGDIFGEKRPNFVVYDEDGNSVYGSSSTIYGNEITMRFSVDAFTGSKTYTFIFYYYDNATGGYEKLAVKKAAVTAKDWLGSISVSKESIYVMERALYCEMYLPATIDTNAVEFCVYDGDKVVGYFQPNGKWEDTSYVYLTSLVPQTENSFYVSLNDSAAKSNYGNIYFARKVEAGKSYAVKAIAGNKTYDLGFIYVDGSSYVSSVYSNEFATSKPVVGIDAYGYKLSDLLIQIKDPETKAVLATSEGGTFYYSSPTSANFVLQSSKSSAELDYCDIVVSYQGKELYSNTYYDSANVVTAYYNHADKVVVVKTTGIPDGTILKAEINNTYTAEGTVTGNSAILQFKKDGAVCELPVGVHDVDFTYTYKEYDEEYERTTYTYVEVMGSTVSGNYEYSANYIDDRYFESGKESPFVITITPNNLEAE
ncbi:MAG: hypothetical protein E7287_11095, partial [Lachnospiraceae bacterium]|nr:hypothetical protein [Lachnospiraceae bacterium]